MNADDVLALALPQFFPAHWLQVPGLVFSDFQSRIRIGYDLRGEGCYAYIQCHEFETLGISLEELHAAALANLRQLPDVNLMVGKVPGGSEGWIQTTDDNFAAARILLPAVQHQFRTELGEGFLVALSHRDDCFCWSHAQPAERQEAHAREALERFMQEEYKLTPDILQFSDTGFGLYREQSAD